MSTNSNPAPEGFRISARTVLELGSELISSDIIAFYELVKNAFDAQSKTGVDIRFNVPLRRNAYLRIRALAEAGEDSAKISNELIRCLDVTADAASRSVFESILDEISQPSFLNAFDEAYRSSCYIEVADTGMGMSISDLVNHYLVIGTPNRKRAVDEAVRTSAAAAPFLGEKGIGRLSAMRLGERLRVETSRSEDTQMNVLDIDWRRFADVGAMVEDIKIAPVLGKVKTDPSWSGTTLVISDLSEDWTPRKVEDMAQFDFARLIDPFLDPKTRPRVALFWNSTRISIPWMDRALLDHGHAKFSGKYEIIDGQPVLQCLLEARDLGFPHPPEKEVVTLTLPDLDGAIVGTSEELPLSALTSLGPFEFEAFWYNRRRLSSIESIGDQKTVRELQRRWSGIMLFRDAFRVFPYGDDDDDWLGLDRKALGRPGYSLNKTQFVGHISVSRLRNPKLADQTNREGLRANPEQQAFILILQHIIQGLLWDFLRDVEKRHKSQRLDLGDVREEVKRLETRADTALKRIRQFAPKQEGEIFDDLQQAFFEFRELAERAQQRIEEVEADSRQMVQMAGVGLMVEVVAHELARSSEAALQALEGLRGREMPDEVRSRFEILRVEMKSVSKRLRVLDPLSISGRQRSEVFDFKELLEDLKEGHAAQFTRHGVLVDLTVPEGALRLRTVKGMIVQIFENLIANSLYWMDLRKRRESRYIPTIKIVVEADPFTVTFSDNGPGIAPENFDKVFRPFWSLKEKTKRRGLGLFIARECATYMGGKLVMGDRADPSTGRLNEFIFELPEGTRA